MEITITTPALIFPTVSLLLLAYTNRYLAVANLIRALSNDLRKHTKHEHALEQLESLYFRVKIIRRMQEFGIASMILSSLSMLFIFMEFQVLGKYFFGVALVLLFGSLLLSLYESSLSSKALYLEIKDIAKNIEE